MLTLFNNAEFSFANGSLRRVLSIKFVFHIRRAPQFVINSVQCENHRCLGNHLRPPCSLILDRSLWLLHRSGRPFKCLSRLLLVLQTEPILRMCSENALKGETL